MSVYPVSVGFSLSSCGDCGFDSSACSSWRSGGGDVATRRRRRESGDDGSAGIESGASLDCGTCGHNTDIS